MHILLAEDDDETAEYVESGLVELGHSVLRARDGERAVQAGLNGHFDAIVLDRMMPKLEGLDVLRRLRAADVQVPIIVLTAKGGIADRVGGLDAGADDYLVKPFAFAELLARLNALSRRSSPGEVTRLEVGDVSIDLLQRKVTRGERPVPLQPREFLLLELLMRNAGRPVTRSMFLEQVWGFHFDPQTNIVESHLSRMRAKLRGDGNDDPIETIRGIGYRMRPDA